MLFFLAVRKPYLIVSGFYEQSQLFGTRPAYILLGTTYWVLVKKLSLSYHNKVSSKGSIRVPLRVL